MTRPTLQELVFQDPNGMYGGRRTVVLVGPIQGGGHVVIESGDQIIFSGPDGIQLADPHLLFHGGLPVLAIVHPSGRITTTDESPAAQLAVAAVMEEIDEA